MMNMLKFCKVKINWTFKEAPAAQHNDTKTAIPTIKNARALNIWCGCVCMFYVRHTETGKFKMINKYTTKVIGKYIQYA